MNRFEQSFEFLKNNRFIFILIFLILFMMFSVFFSREATDTTKKTFPIEEKTVFMEDYTVTYRTNGEVHVLVRDFKKAGIETIRNTLGLTKYDKIIVEIPGAAEYIGDDVLISPIYEGDLSNVGD